MKQNVVNLSYLKSTQNHFSSSSSFLIFIMPLRGFVMSSSTRTQKEGSPYTVIVVWIRIHKNANIVSYYFYHMLQDEPHWQVVGLNLEHGLVEVDSLQ